MTKQEINEWRKQCILQIDMWIADKYTLKTQLVIANKQAEAEIENDIKKYKELRANHLKQIENDL